ncbi:hypothetical protein ACJX0J_036007 [Zea mays]
MYLFVNDIPSLGLGLDRPNKKKCRLMHTNLSHFSCFDLKYMDLEFSSSRSPWNILSTKNEKKTHKEVTPSIPNETSMTFPHYITTDLVTSFSKHRKLKQLLLPKTVRIHSPRNFLMCRKIRYSLLEKTGEENRFLVEFSRPLRYMYITIKKHGREETASEISASNFHLGIFGLTDSTSVYTTPLLQQLQWLNKGFHVPTLLQIHFAKWKHRLYMMGNCWGALGTTLVDNFIVLALGTKHDKGC